MEPILRTLFVNTPGTRLVLDGNAVKALRDDAPMRRLPLEALDSLVVVSGVDVSTPLLIHCAEGGRTVVFLSRNGKPRAIVEGVLAGRSELRRLQYAAHADPSRRLAMAGDLVRGKLAHMVWALRQWARDASPQVQTNLRRVADHLEEVCGREGMTRDEWLGIEGESTRRYFECFGSVLKEGEWRGRNRRPPTDPFNATLSILYGLTQVAVTGGLAVAGLDTGSGFLHGDRPGQPSLVLDMMEELRPAADRLAIKLWNTRRLQDKHFAISVSRAVELTQEGREVVFDAWHSHRSAPVEVAGRKGAVSNGFIPIMQAHALANALRRDSPYLAHRRLVK